MFIGNLVQEISYLCQNNICSIINNQTITIGQIRKSKFTKIYVMKQSHYEIVGFLTLVQVYS